MKYVYFLKCSDGKTYTGSTGNVEQRLIAHRNGEVSFTKSRLPVELITYIAFSDRQKAYDFERYAKSGSGIAFARKRFF